MLLGIVALRWLRSQRYADTTKSKEALAIFRMRSETLEEWHIPQVFTRLSLLLQAALVLFFVGMVDIPLTLDGTVAFLVIVVVILPLSRNHDTPHIPMLHTSNILAIAKRLRPSPVFI
ncbi:hypothetical protein BDZ97DRAFT_1996341 [Flammula alnicola]|nr:hypothetical protein BDZ97DRAFT_1996341 [Flammula alnicola]